MTVLKGVLRKTTENKPNKTTKQTLKLKDAKVTINDKQLKRSSTKMAFFKKYEIGDLIKEGGNGAVFKGKKIKINLLIFEIVWFCEYFSHF